MLRVAGKPGPVEEAYDVRFRESETWDAPEVLDALGPVRPLDIAIVQFGDDVVGPALLLVSTRPNLELPPGPAHGHASDSWRMPLLGSLAMGRTVYGAGDFRFQRGWRPYPSDNFAMGPEGGWTVLLFGDRRGTRARRSGSEESFDAEALEKAFAMWAGIGGDQLDPDDACPESTLATTLGDGSRAGRVDGSFADTSGWQEDASGVRRVAGSIGDATVGPLVVLSEAPAGAAVAPAGTTSCDVVRIVVRGGCSIGGRELVVGDVRVQPAGAVEDVVAGPEGLSEVAIVADRRAVVADESGWAACHRDLAPVGAAAG